MKILFIGDIIGKPGRKTVRAVLPKLIKEHKPDLVLANAENLSHGNGFSRKNIKELQDCGIHFFTSGDHFTGNREGFHALNDKNFPVIRPANLPQNEDIPGRGYDVVKIGKYKILVINLIGRVFMKKHYDCPFKTLDRILAEFKGKKLNAIIVDIHAEATSEKYALGFYADGRVSAVVGTHTHVPTKDAHLLPKKTAFISDIGMTGPLDSVIGIDKEAIIRSFLTQLPVRHNPEEKGEMVFNAVIVEVDPKTKKGLNIRHEQRECP